MFQQPPPVKINGAWNLPDFLKRKKNKKKCAVMIRIKEGGEKQDGDRNFIAFHCAYLQEIKFRRRTRTAFFKAFSVPKYIIWVSCCNKYLRCLIFCLHLIVQCIMKRSNFISFLQAQVCEQLPL